MIATGYTTRELCDGQSPWRRRAVLGVARTMADQAERLSRQCIVTSNSCFVMGYSRAAGTSELLVQLALCKVADCPYNSKSFADDNRRVVEEAGGVGVKLYRIPIDYRLIDLLMRAAGDPEVSQGSFEAVVPDASCILYAQEKVASRTVRCALEHTPRGDHTLVASMGELRKETPGDVLAAPVLVDGTNGIAVNGMTRIRDQERVPIAADVDTLHETDGDEGANDVRTHCGRCRGAPTGAEC